MILSSAVHNGTVFSFGVVGEAMLRNTLGDSGRLKAGDDIIPESKAMGDSGISDTGGGTTGRS